MSWVASSKAQPAMQIKSIFSFLLRWTLLLKVIRYHLESSQACHSTTIYVQNGTWLNTSRWLQNGFFGSQDTLPLTGKPTNLSADYTTTRNPVLPLLPTIPNRQQGCVCGGMRVKCVYYFNFQFVKILSILVEKKFTRSKRIVKRGVDKYGA